MSAAKTYVRHRCTKAHRTFKAFAKCAFPTRTAWIIGDGRYASVAWCRVPTVMLFDDLTKAQHAKAQIDSSACGGGCVRNHEIIELVMGAQP